MGQQIVQKAQRDILCCGTCKSDLEVHHAGQCNFLGQKFRYNLVFFKDPTMGKLNVSMLRYLSSEEFRVLTAVSW